MLTRTMGLIGATGANQQIGAGQLRHIHWREAGDYAAMFVWSVGSLSCRWQAVEET